MAHLVLGPLDADEQRRCSAGNGGGRLQPALMRHPTSYLSKLGGEGSLGGGGVRLEGVAIKQRIQSSHIPPCHRHMVIGTNLSSLFDMLLFSTPQTRA